MANAGGNGVIFEVEAGRLDFALPRMVPVEQRLEVLREEDVAGAVRRELGKLAGQLSPGARVAVGVGSRGLADLPLLVRACVSELRRQGLDPFLIPAMGSHGGATSEGQLEVLAGYGLTPDSMGVEIRAGMEVDLIGRLADGTAVYFSREALAADAVLPLNRVKMHTAFRGPVESGLSKMLAIGFGKHKGAASLHQKGSEEFGWVVPQAAALILERVPVIGGLASVENGLEQVGRLEFVPGPLIPSREPELLDLSRRLMPRIPFTGLDLLVVDRIGKDLSGDGMDPNVTGRHPTARMTDPERDPRRLVALRASEQTHGNLCGLGVADLTTAALVDQIDYQQTWTNTVTSLELALGKTPMWVGDDRTAIALALSSLSGVVPIDARVARISSTLHLQRLWVSEALWEAEGPGREDVWSVGEPRDMEFDTAGHLVDLPRPSRRRR